MMKSKMEKNGMDKTCKLIGIFGSWHETEDADDEDKVSPANELPHMELMDGHDSRHSWYKSGLSSIKLLIQ